METPKNINPEQMQNIDPAQAAGNLAAHGAVEAPQEGGYDYLFDPNHEAEPVSQPGNGLSEQRQAQIRQGTDKQLDLTERHGTTWVKPQ